MTARTVRSILIDFDKAYGLKFSLQTYKEEVEGKVRQLLKLTTGQPIKDHVSDLECLVMQQLEATAHRREDLGVATIDANVFVLIVDDARVQALATESKQALKNILNARTSYGITLKAHLLLHPKSTEREWFMKRCRAERVLKKMIADIEIRSEYE